MRGYIRQLEDEISELKRQMAFAQKNEKEIAELKRQLELAKAEASRKSQVVYDSPHHRKSNAPSMYSAGVQKVDDVQERIL